MNRQTPILIYKVPCLNREKNDYCEKFFTCNQAYIRKWCPTCRYRYKLKNKKYD